MNVVTNSFTTISNNIHLLYIYLCVCVLYMYIIPITKDENEGQAKNLYDRRICVKRFI